MKLQTNIDQQDPNLEPSRLASGGMPQKEITLDLKPER
jgi:hypothetical protein